MTIARSQVVLLGSSEASGTTTANGATSTSSETDLLGDATSQGVINVYLKFTAAAPQGNVKLTLSQSRVSSSPYPVRTYNFNGALSGVLIFVDRIPWGRFITAAVQNELQSGGLTGVFVAVELEKTT